MSRVMEKLKTMQSVYVFTLYHESLFTGAQCQKFVNVEFLSDYS